MSIAISIAALAVSLSAFLSTRWRDRRDLMLRVHERLVTRDQQRGRRLVFEMSEKKTQVEDLGADDYELINNSLAALDVLGIYYKRRYIRRKDALEIWAAQVLRVVRAAQPFLKHRDALSRGSTWPHLLAFAEDAQSYIERPDPMFQRYRGANIAKPSA